MKIIGYVKATGCVAGAVAMVSSAGCSSTSSSGFDGGFSDSAAEDSWRVYDSMPDADVGADVPISKDAGADVPADASQDLSADVAPDTSIDTSQDVAPDSAQDATGEPAEVQCGDSGTMWEDYRDNLCMSCDAVGILGCGIISATTFDTDCSMFTLNIMPGRIQITSAIFNGGYANPTCANQADISSTSGNVIVSVERDKIFINLANDAAGKQVCTAQVTMFDACNQIIPPMNQGTEVFLDVEPDAGTSADGGEADAFCGVNLQQFGCSGY